MKMLSRNLSRKVSRNPVLSRHPRYPVGYSHSSSSLSFRILKRVTPAGPRAGRPSAHRRHDHLSTSTSTTNQLTPFITHCRSTCSINSSTRLV